MDEMMLQTMTEPKAPFASADARWKAFIGRDPAAYGRFIAAVTSTGIYCRPTCTARKPKRENVEFYRTPAEAEAAGFRPCTRCRPLEMAVGSGGGGHAAAVAEACRLIAEAEELQRLHDLARAAGLSRFHFHRVFKQAKGLTP